MQRVFHGRFDSIVSVGEGMTLSPQDKWDLAVVIAFVVFVLWVFFW